MFQPYNRFGGAASLQREVAQLRDRGAAPAGVLDAHDRYHYSLLHKLKSAQEHVESLKDFLSAGTDAGALELVYRVNFHFDGFVYVVASAMDIFAREIMAYYDVAPPNRVYFHTAAQQFGQQRPGDPIIARLGNPPWRAEFQDYRNAATHETVIGTEYTVAVTVIGAREERRIVFPLPDDPRDPQSACRRNKDIVAYVESTLRRVLRQLNPVYVHIAREIRNSGALPL